MKAKKTLRFGALAAFGASGLALAGCGGGDSDSSTPQNIPAASIVALSSSNELSFFDSRTPYSSTTRNVSGLTSGEQLIGIDYRFAPIAGATTGAGLYGLVRAGASGASRLVRIDISNNAAAATTVGSSFTLPFTGSNIGFDFNPVVDRIRVVDSTSRINLRLNPDTGALVDADPTTDGNQTDGTLTYDTGDAGNGTAPRLVGAAYTNNVVGTTSTINYAIDAARGALVTQGRAATATSEAVSPNTGRLFTVGTLTGISTNASGAGFDIAPTSNNAYVAIASNSSSARLYAINLSTAALSGGATISLGSRPVLGIAVLPSTQTAG